MNPAFPVRNFLLMLLMLAAASLAVGLKPSTRVGAPVARINLESIIPTAFGEWTQDKRYSPIMPPPELEEKVNATYDETLARTYVNKRGDFIMLSIAYGGDQTGRLRVHRPESCYPAQGFSVDTVGEVTLQTSGGKISANRLIAQSGNRTEPITYWIRLGKSTVSTALEQRISQLKFGLTGEIPDGLIFRVSTIDRDVDRAFRIHFEFIDNLIKSVPASTNETLIGNGTN